MKFAIAASVPWNLRFDHSPQIPAGAVLLFLVMMILILAVMVRLVSRYNKSQG